jgi:hypothetical protein
VPVSLVRDLAAGHALVALRIPGVGPDLAAVEQVDVGAQFVALAVVGRVAKSFIMVP